MDLEKHQPDPFYDVAIIGAGFSGLMTAVNILKLSPKPIRIALLEKGTTLGAGVAFSTEDTSHLLNVPVEKMSAFGDEPLHFFQWCVRHQDQYPEMRAVETNPYLPRTYYRFYLQDILDQIQKQRAACVVTHLATECLDIEPTADGPTLMLSHGASVRCRRVVLAMSHVGAASPVPMDLVDRGEVRYIHNPWVKGCLEKVGTQDRVLLLGTGLTMVDVALTLTKQQLVHPLTAVSRRGLFPQFHHHSPKPAVSFSKDDLMLSPVNMIKFLRREISKDRGDGYRWHQVIDGLRPYNQAIWGQMTGKQRQSFLRHGKPYWDVHRHRMAPKVREQLQKLFDSDRLKIIAGRIVAWTPLLPHLPGVMTLTVKQRRGGERLNLPVDCVINCTGGTAVIDSTQDPLMVNLKARGVVCSHTVGIGIQTNSDGAVVGRNGASIPWLSVLGALRGGDLGESTAVPELRVQAKELARQILADSRGLECGL